ncbi:hypothetical protein Tco_1255766 [Tanacetum coccineum]
MASLHMSWLKPELINMALTISFKDEESNLEEAQTLVMPPKQQQHKWKPRREFQLEGWLLLGTFTGYCAKILAVEKERKAKNILLMAILKRTYEKDSWEWMMQKKYGSPSELERDMTDFKHYFLKWEAHGAEVSTEDVNHKFLRFYAFSLQEIQGAPKTSSSAQNVAFVSQSKGSTNKVKSGFSGAYSSCTPSTSSTNIPEKEVLAGFANESSIPSLPNKQRIWTTFMRFGETV